MVRRASTSAAAPWLVALNSLPAFVTGEGEPYRPRMVIWKERSGPVLAVEMLSPTDDLAAAVTRSYDSACATPMMGPPRTPSEIHASDPTIADALAGHVGRNTKVRLMPTPEIDEVLAMMRDDLTSPGSEPNACVYEGVSVDAVAALYAAAARLHRAKPWRTMTETRGPIGVTVTACDINGYVVIVMGQLGDVFGLAIYESVEHMEAFLESVERGRGRPVGGDAVYCQTTLMFEPARELPASLRKQVMAHGFEVAGRDAYPVFRILDNDLLARDPSAKEVEQLRAIVTAIAVRAEEHAQADAPLAPAARTIEVPIAQGTVSVQLDDPLGAAASEALLAARFDVRFELEADAPESDEDNRALHDYVHALVARFERSPEYVRLGVGKAPSAEMLILTTVMMCGGGMHLLMPPLLEAFLYHALPDRPIPPSAAPAIVEELRALLSFLRREYHLDNIPECEAVLDHRVVVNLRAALSGRGEPRSKAARKRDNKRRR